ELTRKQQKAPAPQRGDLPRIVDPRTHETYVLLPFDRYERVRAYLEPQEAERSKIPVEVPEGIQRSRAAFLRDLPTLLKQKNRRGQWVAYHGEQRLGFARTETELYQKCLRRGLKELEFYVGWILPQSSETETVDPSVFEFEEVILDPPPGPHT